MSTLLDLFKTMEYGPAPESASAVKAWLEEHGRKFGLFINNEWVTPKGAKYYSSYNPASGELLGETVQAEKKDVDTAVAAAQTAFESWSKTPGLVRARYMYAIARNIQKHHRLLAVLESMDNGKPIRESRDVDVALLARHFYVYLASKINEDKVTFLGYSNFRIRLMSFVIANTTTALAGSLYAIYLGFVSPEITSPARAADPVVVTILGGVGTLYGPIVGAIAYTGMKDVISKLIGNWELFIGFLLVFIMLAGAKGIWGTVQPRLAKLLTRKSGAVAKETR